MSERSAGTHAGRFRTWLAHHGFSLVASLGRLLRRPWSSLLTIAVMALALALPLALGLALQNLARLDDALQAAHEVNVFLAPGTANDQAAALARALRARPDVATVEVIPPTQALARMRARPELADAIDALGEEVARNALPVVLRLHARGDEHALAAAVQAMPGVERVQYDAVWRQRLQAWLGFGTRIAQVLAVLLGLGALLVVGNTVRLDIQSRHEEIAVLQLLGASDGFVRRPFLYLGLSYGLAAGALALAILAAVRVALEAPLAALAASYGGAFALQGLRWPDIVGVLAVAGLLGWLGAVLAVGHHLRQNRPLEG